jgi:3-oxoadipate CoA-transferase alpha subunit
MQGKLFESAEEAVAVVRDGDTVLVGGFGNAGVPELLIASLVRNGRRDLTIVSNNCGTGESGLALLFKYGLVSKVCASFPSQAGNDHFLSRLQDGTCELELVPQGTLVARLDAAAAGLGGVLTPTGVGTELTAGKEVTVIAGRAYVFDLPLRGDVALVASYRADEAGNLRYRGSARNFNPVMAMAARVTVAQAVIVGPPGTIDPDDVHTPGVFVDRVVVAS